MTGAKVEPYTTDADRPEHMKIFKPHLKESDAKVKIAMFFDKTLGVIIMSSATLFALFADDISKALFPAAADAAIQWIAFVVLWLFLVEWLAMCITHQGYMWSFFFVLDFVALITLLMDVPFASSLLSATENTDVMGTEVARAGRAAKSGSKATKIIRVVRIVRLLRMFKLYKYLMGGNKDMQTLQEQEEEQFSSELSGSEIGKKLGMTTTKIVIIVVLSTLLVFPLLELDKTDESWAFRLNALATRSEMTNLNLYDDMLAEMKAQPEILEIITPNGTMLQEKAVIDGLRDSEMRSFTISGEDWTAKIDIQALSKTTSAMSILMTLIVMVLLGVATYSFSKDANDMVVYPIERMVKFVQQLAQNPLGKIKPMVNKNNKQPEGMETVLLENTLMKLGGLLQVSFGTAGSEIIGKNLDGGGGLNVMIPGQKIFAVFGFCDIRYFNDITELLQSEVMLFVNQVAEIVHERTHRYNGAANKNTGNAFLLVWKFPQIKGGSIVDATNNPVLEEKGMAQEPLVLGDDAESKELQLHVANPAMRMAVQNLADQALTAFLQTIVQVATHDELDRWRVHPKLSAEEGHYEVDMGFGLHIGWSIEGAIGSPYKVDASYLSPNVNMAARLEAATKQYGVRLLFSGVFYGLLQPEIQARCRLLDRITVKGSLVPIDCYTFDIINPRHKRGSKAQIIGGQDNIGPVPLTSLVQASGQIEDPETRASQSSMLNVIKGKMGGHQTNKVAPSHLADVEMLTKKEAEEDGTTKYTNEELLAAVSALQTGIHPDFVKTFNRATQRYVKGDWAQAKNLITMALELKPDDKPAQVLLRVMGEHDFVAPKDWQGFRALTSK